MARRATTGEAGWYDDPAGHGDYRWWDGTRWSHTISHGAVTEEDLAAVDALPRTLQRAPFIVPVLPPAPESFFDVRGDLVRKAGRAVWSATLAAFRQPAPVRGEVGNLGRRWLGALTRGVGTVAMDAGGVTVHGLRKARFAWSDIERFVVECRVNSSIGDESGPHVSKRFGVVLRGATTVESFDLVPWRLVPILNRRLAAERGCAWPGPPRAVLDQMVVV